MSGLRLDHLGALFARGFVTAVLVVSAVAVVIGGWLVAEAWDRWRARG